MKTLAPSITPTVLMVDDNAAFLESTVRVLRAAGISHPVITAGNATETINSIHTLEGPAILFVDLNLRGRMNGTALLRYARSIARHPVVAFYLSADEREDVQAAALRAGGASGYLVKPVHPDRLIAHIAIATEQIENILGANHDVLTGSLLSRKEFDMRAVVELERAARAQGQTAGIFADIDDFGRGLFGAALVAAILSVVAFITPTALHRFGDRTARGERLQISIVTTRVGLLLLAQLVGDLEVHPLGHGIRRRASGCGGCRWWPGRAGPPPD